MSLVLKELASADATNRRNAAFCVGELCKNGGDAALKYAFGYIPCLPSTSVPNIRSEFVGL